MQFWQNIIDFFLNIVSGSSPEAMKKKELRRIYTNLNSAKLHYVKQGTQTLEIGFAQALFSFCKILSPIQDIVRKTIANQDIRVSQRYYELIVESHLPSEQREARKYFTYDGMLERLNSAMNIDAELETISASFQRYLSVLETPDLRTLEIELYDLEKLVDLCKYDYERILGLFDPGLNLDNPGYKPDFSMCANQAVFKELLDLYSVVNDFMITPRVCANLEILLKRISAAGVNPEEQVKRLQKVITSINKALTHDLSGSVLLDLVRILKQDPYFVEKVSIDRKSLLNEYTKRIEHQFSKDRERIIREKHESSVSSDITSLFGSENILEFEGYCDDLNAQIQTVSPNIFTKVKPLRILKTFVLNHFNAKMKEPIKRILVEGYFDNKVFQNNMANIFFQCERSSERLNSFEESLINAGRYSTLTLRRYIEEAKRGKDMAQFVDKLVDTLNARATEIVENETNLYCLLADALYEILSDFKRASPELITNIRGLGMAKNKELVQNISTAYNEIQKLARIMKNFTIIKAGAMQAALKAQSKVSDEMGTLEDA